MIFLGDVLSPQIFLRESREFIQELLRESQDGARDVDFKPFVQRLSLNLVLTLNYGTRWVSAYKGIRDLFAYQPDGLQRRQHKRPHGRPALCRSHRGRARDLDAAVDVQEPGQLHPAAAHHRSDRVMAGIRQVCQILGADRPAADCVQ